ncbi:MAG TPA: ABC transporter substrate-binding protein [Niabella sp.]|jgi:ABC-type branched-subunit amino acid transport system substrate-binding protein|nr:ABC transporter substrate-binding protein [Chitinophagaceae bacterium]HRO85265.1 ABC transporter substrate-binding protein [Niabella sp.]HUN03929.1 ABC transporter substrate-binding protein [Niabella sp.]
MMRFCFFFFIFFIGLGSLQAQVTETTAKRHKMAIFTPLFLDDAFDAAGSYRFSTKTFPKNTIPGLEFYHGAQIAADSLNSLNIPLDLYVYDSKSGSATLEQQFQKAVSDSVELVIANFAIADVAKYAKLAADKKMTLINAAVPNDGNAKDNPYFIVINPTFQTQIESIFKYIKANFASRQIIVLTGKGTSENYIRSAFESLNKQKDSISLSLKFVEASDTVAVNKSIAALDKTKQPLFVIGSLDVNLGAAQLKRLSAISSQFSVISTVMGMPTWESISLSKSEFKGLEVIYSTPFYNSGNDAYSKGILAYYTKNMFAKPSDLVYRSFGLVFRFGRLLNQYGKEVNAHLDDKQFRVMYDYDIQPVFNNHHLNYFENKKLYFLKFYNGILQQVN